jgi:hypothetical protein
MMNLIAWCVLFSQSNGEEYELRMLIHQSLAGCVIGKSGGKIKELKDVSTFISIHFILHTLNQMVH